MRDRNDDKIRDDKIRSDEAATLSPWLRSFSLEGIKCLIVCRGPVRKEAIDIFDEVGVAEYGILLSEKDSVVYPRCYAPELRDFRLRNNVHRVPDYMGTGAEDRGERIQEIVEIATQNGYTHIFAGYGFMAEDAEFIEAIEDAGIAFVGPSSKVARRAGAKDEAKKLARSLDVSVTPGVDNVSALALLARVKDARGLGTVAEEKDLPFANDPEASVEENAEALLELSYRHQRELVTIPELQRETTYQAEKIWERYPGRRLRLKHIGGGGGKGQRIVSSQEDVPEAILEVLAEAKALEAGSNRNFLIELNIEKTRHNEIQLLGNGHWSIALGGRDCSLQMHEQKLLEVSLTRELLDAEIAACEETRPARAAVLKQDRHALAEMEGEAERFGEAVNLDSVSTFESIVDGDRHFFMEMNTRIQVEHRVTEMVYRLKFTNPEDASDVFYVESLIEAMLLVARHGERLPKPVREARYCAGAEVRINATNQALQPHAGGVIYAWSAPIPGELRDDQGIGTRNPDTGAFVWYHIAGAYDSNIALVVSHGEDRRDNLARLTEILRKMELRGENLQTNMQMHYGLLNFLIGFDPMLKPSTQFMDRYLAAVGALQDVVNDVDFDLAWRREIGCAEAQAKEILQSKQTLILRPLRYIFSNAHLLAGFLARHRDVLWGWADGEPFFKTNPLVFLERLYHCLHLEWQDDKAPSEMIWDHDKAQLDRALGFYETCALRAKTGEDWGALTRIFDEGEGLEAIAEGDETLWEACRASDRGFRLGMDLLLMIPRAGAVSGFRDIQVNDALEPIFPRRFEDAEERGALARVLAPPPKASADEILSPVGGHFYAREAPELPILVDEGDHFEAGQPLFIVEVMKMFNKIRAPFSGTVTKNMMAEADGKIIVEGQQIFQIEPDERIPEETPEEVAGRREAATGRLLGL